MSDENKKLKELISEQAYENNYLDCIIKLLELNQRLENKVIELEKRFKMHINDIDSAHRI